MKLRDVFITERNCITPIGFDVATNVQNIIDGVSGIRLYLNEHLMQAPFYASVIDEMIVNTAFGQYADPAVYTKLEQMMLLALIPVIEKVKPTFDQKTVLIISTTKGNINALENLSDAGIQQADLNLLAKKIAAFFGFSTQPIIVCNACVSGILAVSIAKRLIQSECYDRVFVVSGDKVSKFVLSGFNSFQAMSDLPCQPYSANRKGVTLGEAAAAMCVTADGTNAVMKVIGDGAINDANHISGPSRTGEGLYRSVERALQEAAIDKHELDYINAHGTATSFNDEMEAIAFNRLGLAHVPLNSLKGYYGHTLGASGLLETVIGIESVVINSLFPSLGFDEMGMSQPLNIISKNEQKQMKYWLKTASGFGGCNTAAVFQKITA